MNMIKQGVKRITFIRYIKNLYQLKKKKYQFLGLLTDLLPSDSLLDGELIPVPNLLYKLAFFKSSILEVYWLLIKALCCERFSLSMVFILSALFEMCMLFDAPDGIEFLFANGSLYNTGIVRLCLSGEPGLKLCLCLTGVICFYLAKLLNDALYQLILV